MSQIPSFVEFFEFQGKQYKIEYFGISFRCAELKIFGQRSVLTCRNSIKRKVKKTLK